MNVQHVTVSHIRFLYLINLVCACVCCVQVEQNRQRKEMEVLHADREREQQEQKIQNLEQELSETQAEIHTLQVIKIFMSIMTFIMHGSDSSPHCKK